MYNYKTGYERNQHACLHRKSGEGVTIIITSPYLFQRQAASAIERFGGRGLVALEPGLGKSLTSLLFAHRRPELRPVVIVCPASMKYSWQNECKKHFNWHGEVLESTTPEQRHSQDGIFIVNYEILGRRGGCKNGNGWLEFLLGHHPQLVIIDECQRIGDRRTKQSQWVRELCEDVENVVALSGTPFTNRPSELFNVLNLLRPDLFRSFTAFSNSFCPAQIRAWGISYDHVQNLDLLHKILVDNLMFRRRKCDVLSQMPVKTRSVVPLPMKDAGQYREASRNFLQWLAKRSQEKAQRASRAESLTRMGYLKQLAALLKMSYVFEWLDSFLEDGDGKIVVFGIHKEILQSLCNRYRKVVVEVTGNVSLRDRQIAVDRFQNDNNTRMFVGNITAAGTGLTLTAAHTVCFVELPWSPASVLQCEERCFGRLNDLHGADIYFLVAGDSIEINLCNVLQRKQENINAIMDGGGVAVDELALASLLEQEMLPPQRGSSWNH